jgi:hypothetical protein
VVEKPDMRIKVRIEIVVGLKNLKKVFPFTTKATGDVNPKSLNLDVVNTPFNYTSVRMEL